MNIWEKRAYNRKQKNIIQHPVGSKVWWDEDKFTDGELATLIHQFGTEPFEIISENQFDYCPSIDGEETRIWAVWVTFKTNDDTVESTRPTNLKVIP